MRVTVGRRPEQGEYVGRPTALGNPFPMLGEVMRDTVCDKYEEWFAKAVANRRPEVMQHLDYLRQRASEQPIKLICFCSPKRCHAETIAKYINDLFKDQESELI